MDGTLVDSEKLWGVGMHELAASYGAVLGDAVRDATVGVAADRAVAMLLDALGYRRRGAGAASPPGT
jgi:beta-phosphoglucomutase-like phosphatase (HAD superfamily)